MKKILNLNITLLIVLILFLVFTINNRVNAENTYKGLNPNIYGEYDKFHEYAFKQVKIKAQEITDSILDMAEKSGIEPEYEVGIKPEEFINRYSANISNIKYNNDLSSISNLLKILPNTEQISFTIVNDIANYLQEYYEREYLRKKRGLNSMQSDFVNEAIVSNMGKNIYTLEKSIIEKFKKINQLIDTKNPLHKAYYEKIKDLPARKTHKPFPPRSIGPDPNAAAHKISTGVQGDDKNNQDSITEIPKPPKDRTVSEDYGEMQLVRALKLPDEQSEEDRIYNLRTYYTEILESNIEKALDEYYKDLNQKQTNIQDLSIQDLLTLQNQILKGEDKIIEDEIRKFLFSRTLRDLEIRHNNIKNALDDLLTITNQIMQLHAIEKDYTKSASNFMPMF